jgi:hypothetical protein
MNMSMKISNKEKSKTVSISFDADRFERVAANFGMFSDDFIKSLDRSEMDIRAGRLTKIDSLRELRK